MRRGERGAGEPSLFDLPLASPEEAVPSAPRRSTSAVARELALEAPAAATQRGPRALPAPTPRQVAGVGRRVLAGLSDLLAHSIVGLLLFAGVRTLGVPLTAGLAAPLALVLAVFSFLYTVIALAFWGRTPGMSWAALRTVSMAGEHLSFAQSSRYWLGMLVTLAFFGLPVLLAWTGRSLTDRLAGARTERLGRG